MCTHRSLMLETNERECLIFARKGTEPVHSRKFTSEASRRENPPPGRDQRARPEWSTYRYEKAGFLRHVDVVLSNNDHYLINLSIVIPAPSLPLDTNDQQAGTGDASKNGPIVSEKFSDEEARMSIDESRPKNRVEWR
ncbi:hypothetical protein N7467_012106 [Penicillium canescens]|nr:hypothetical protein N7467_012106 [Penicillium canescens]